VGREILYQCFYATNQVPSASSSYSVVPADRAESRGLKSIQ